MKGLRIVLLAILLALFVGFVIGTILRSRLERPVYYIGSAIAPHPLDIGDSCTPVFDTRHYEEQIG